MNQLYPGKALEDGTIYVGVLLDKDKNQGYHLSIEPKDEIGIYTYDGAIKAFGNRMPTIDELRCIYGANLKLLSSYYWSSTEYINGNAWIFVFSSNYLGTHDKTYDYPVRCVRRFDYFDLPAKEVTLEHNGIKYTIDIEKAKKLGVIK